MAKVQKTSETPNPLAIRFHMDCKVTASGSRSYPDVESAQADPIAAQLFQIPHVTSVFYVGTTVTVNKDEEGDWNAILTPVADVLEANLVSAQEPAAESDFDPHAAGAGIHRPENFFEMPLEEQIGHINRIFDEMVRPGLAGGVFSDKRVAQSRYASVINASPSAFVIIFLTIHGCKM